MSGGSLNYAYSRVEDIANEVTMRATCNLHRAFATHLRKVATALHDLEWVLSDGYGPGDEVESIRAVVTQKEEVEEAKRMAAELMAELAAFIGSNDKKQGGAA